MPIHCKHLKAEAKTVGLMLLRENLIQLNCIAFSLFYQTGNSSLDKVI